MTRKKRKKKRGSYKRRLHKPLFDIKKKTTTPEGYREYMRLYMRELRRLNRVSRKVLNK